MDLQRNYQKELDKIILNLTDRGVTPTLLLHSCCAPCSSYVLEYLSNYFHITIFYYNPNISSIEEYERRVTEQQRLLQKLPAKHPIQFIPGNYEPDRFYQMSKGMEILLEGGLRCEKCYEMRLRETAILASEEGFDYFTTTLSISPHKNASKLNEIGEHLSRELNVSYLYSDFKKKNGYKRSTELSKEYNLYRQDYCGCIFSKVESEKRMKEQPDLLTTEKSTQ